MDLHEFVAGRYEALREYNAFLPELIHHEWVIAEPEVIALLGRADRALGELNAFSQLIPDIDFFIKMHVAKEATQSSRIEGTQTRMEDVFKEIAQLNPEEVDDWAEVQNYVAAIRQAIASLERLPISNRLLCETHARLLQGVRGATKPPGEWRRSQNWIGVSLRNAVFVPPHHEHLPDLMSDLERFLNDQSLHTPPLVRIAIAHYQFETIHPFLDGNGRLGRLMISLYLAAEGLLAKPALYLSDYFQRNKTAYIDHLMAVREGNHLREWLIFFLHGVEETAKASVRVFREILELKNWVDTEILPCFSATRHRNAAVLMRLLYERPVMEVKSASEKIGVTSTTAASLVRDLEAMGVLVELTGNKRNRLYCFERYLALFRE